MEYVKQRGIILVDDDRYLFASLVVSSSLQYRFAAKLRILLETAKQMGNYLPLAST